MTDTRQATDIDDALENKGRHFVMVHRVCAPPPAGTLLLAICGALFRRIGETIPASRDDADVCKKCEAHKWGACCVTCGTPIVTEAWRAEVLRNENPRGA